MFIKIRKYIDKKRVEKVHRRLRKCAEKARKAHEAAMRD